MDNVKHPHNLASLLSRRFARVYIPGGILVTVVFTVVFCHNFIPGMQCGHRATAVVELRQQLRRHCMLHRGIKAAFSSPCDSTEHNEPTNHRGQPHDNHENEMDPGGR